MLNRSLPSASRRRLNIEQVRLDEGPRIGGLEALPAIEIDKGVRVGKLLLKLVEVLLVDIEPEKCKALLFDEAPDLRNRELVLHDMEQHVAAVAHREEIMDRAQLLPERVVANELLTTCANAFRR